MSGSVVHQAAQSLGNIKLCLKFKDTKAIVVVQYVSGNLELNNSDSLTLSAKQKLKPNDSYLKFFEKKMESDSQFRSLLMTSDKTADNALNEMIKYIRKKKRPVRGTIVDSGDQQYTAYIFNSCDFANEHLKKADPNHGGLDDKQLLVIILENN